MGRKNSGDFADVVAGVEEKIREMQKRLETPNTPDELEIELQNYFSAQDLRGRVANRVVDKILNEDLGLEQLIIDRLVERIHERLAAKATSGSRNRES